MDTMRYYLPGVILLLIGILIVAVPEVLVAFVASAIVMAGIGALYIGHNIRKSEKELRHVNDWFLTEDFFGPGFARGPIFSDRHRWLF